MTQGQAALESLLCGDLEDWSGLLPYSSRQDAEAAFGPSVGGPDGVASIARALTFRDYPPHPPFAPHGITAWLSGDVLVAFRVVQAAVPEQELESLGPPEVHEESSIAPMHVHDAWPHRGLTVHRHVYTGQVLQLYGYQPLDVDAYRTSWIAGMEYRRFERPFDG
jgi:hypothetical protein